MSPDAPRRYSKTDLRRGHVPPATAAAQPREVASDEQAALFGEGLEGNDRFPMAKDQGMSPETPDATG